MTNNPPNLFNLTTNFGNHSQSEHSISNDQLFTFPTPLYNNNRNQPTEINLNDEDETNKEKTHEEEEALNEKQLDREIESLGDQRSKRSYRNLKEFYRENKKLSYDVIRVLLFGDNIFSKASVPPFIGPIVLDYQTPVKFFLSKKKIEREKRRAKKLGLEPYIYILNLKVNRLKNKRNSPDNVIMSLQSPQLNPKNSIISIKINKKEINTSFSVPLKLDLNTFNQQRNELIVRTKKRGIIAVVAIQYLEVKNFVTQNSIKQVINSIKQLSTFQPNESLSKIKKTLGWGNNTSQKTNNNNQTKFNQDLIDDLQQMSISISLICPLGRKRISIPSKGINCTHIQCFDLECFLRFAIENQIFNCPCCEKILKVEHLMIDGLIQNILNETEKQQAQEITLFPTGKWETQTNKQGKTSTSTSSSKEKDLDVEILILEDDSIDIDPKNQKKQINQIGQINQINEISKMSEINQINQINQLTQINQINQLTQINPLNQINKLDERKRKTAIQSVENTPTENIQKRFRKIN
ncbi:tonalli [Anaeramoeba flamelloides]|uniref:Tonalli n=1 Tax=Anaeramoeba flamelloides TaxID=1746091 RepID=A0ABQ8X2J7_9EUKA|nr:tonalli [Anaeramoeba flamelloides]